MALLRRTIAQPVSIDWTSIPNPGEKCGPRILENGESCLSQPDLIGIFGGTFDPIHNGHINSVASLLDEFYFKTIYLLPSSTPPHRAPTFFTAEDRLKMVELAIENYARLKADDRESRSGVVSYTIDTLISFRSQFPDDSLAFIAGMDAFLQMPGWKRWQDYLHYAHIIVMQRPGYDPADDAWGQDCVTVDKAQILNSTAGRIYYADSMLVDISSTVIRKKLKAGQNLDSEIPGPVINYIRTKQLYAHT